VATQEHELPDVSDEVLARFGMTRERWEAIRAARRAREERAPDVGDPAPDFELPLLHDRSTTVRLSSFRDQQPVALIFGSYT
jgi:hypothetical protein